MNCRRCGATLDADRAETLLVLDIAWWDLCGPRAEAEVQSLATEESDPSAFAHRLTVAHGYLELGMPQEAWNELEAIEPPQRRAEAPVLGLRVAIYHALERWGPMVEVCRHLATVQPGEICWTL